MTEAGVIAVHERGSNAADAVEKVAKGLELALPAGVYFNDKDGHRRTHVRIRWWQHAPAPRWRNIAIAPPAVLAQLPDATIDWPADLGYPADAPPIFVGHYWWSGEPAPLAPNVACVDYSVGRAGGTLVAYRWSGETRLHASHFVAVPRAAQSKAC
ncbi:MAG TPA: diadenosine tetraphosphatase [Gammaproteobacteria bacterium]|nr:diadenosine tetraphosphatase [Gammaproteobacteria bacterium]